MRYLLYGLLIVVSPVLIKHSNPLFNFLTYGVKRSVVYESAVYIIGIILIVEPVMCLIKRHKKNKHKNRYK